MIRVPFLLDGEKGLEKAEERERLLEEREDTETLKFIPLWLLFPQIP